MAEQVRLGQQTPTQSHILPYTVTYGMEAIDLYEKTGRKAQEWQKLLVYDICSINDEKLYVHTKFGYAVPRRNGKNEIVAIREMWGAVKRGEHILHTAHRTTTSRSAWERLKQLLDDAEIEYKASAILGMECIRIKGGTGRIDFRTRTSKGGLGEGFDLMVIDEAQEYTDDQEASLKYVVSASPNPQTLFCGTPPTTESSGTVFAHMRDAVFAGQSEDTGWAEWSVEEQVDPHNSEYWYMTNPSLGTVLKERVIKAEIGENVLDFNIQRLGYWIRYNLKSAISKVEWEELQCEKDIKLRSKVFVGVKFSKTDTVAVSVAVRAADGRIFVESIDCRSTRVGVKWIVDFLRPLDMKAVVVDGANGQTLLAEAMKDAHLKPPVFPSVKDIVTANASFEQRLVTKELCHTNQMSLMMSASNCEKRAIGTNGGFGYRSINENIDVALLDSVILAQWICGTKTKKTGKKQIVRC